MRFDKAQIRTALSQHVYQRKHTIIDCLFFSVIALILTLIWFRGGLLLARGEIGLDFYNYPRLLEGFGYTWLEQIHTGVPASGTYTTIPFFALMSFFDSLFRAPVFEQAAVIFSLLFLTEFSMYYLTKSLIKGQIRRLAGIIAGLFYLLNPYTMTAIWHRAAFGLWFILPVFPMVLCLYLKGIESEKPIRYALLVNLILGSFSIMFMNPSFLLVVLFLSFSATFTYLFQKQTNNLARRIYRVLKFSGITLILFFLLNSWWILPSILLIPQTFVRAMPAEYNIQTFVGVSQSFSLQNMMRLMHEYNFLWQPVYYTTVFQFIGFSIPIFAFSALLFKSRNKFVLFFSLLALFGIFVTKGTQPPLGTELTLWVFKNVPILQTFRNPFEKLGVITSLSYAFLIGFTLSAICLYLENLFRPRQLLHSIKASLLIVIVLLSLVSGLFVFPMWTGEVMSEEGGNLPWGWVGIPWFAEIPSYYRLADNWLGGQPEAFRIIGLPMSETESAHYNWSSGFFGMNPWNLFSKTMITTRADSPFVNDITQSLEYRLSSSGQFWKFLGLLNAKYICLHHDSAYPSAVTRAQSPETIDRILTSNHSIPDYENQNQLTNSESTAFWKPYGITLAADIMLDNLSLREGEATLKINAQVKKGNWEGGMKFAPPRSLNLSEYSFLTFWVKTDSLSNAQSIWFRIWDSHENWRGWEITNNVAQGKWNKAYIDLAKGFQTSVAPNMSDINSISFGVVSREREPVSIRLWLDDINLIPGKNVFGLDRIHYVKTFGELDFYEVDNEYFMPRIYAANQFTISQDVSTMLDTLSFEPMDPRDNVIFLDSQSSINNITFLSDLGIQEFHKPDILFQQVNPTKYEVLIRNATNPFFLVFSSTYDDKWTANINGDYVSNQRHFVGNGYANAWYIDKTGSYQITLEFGPQKLFTYGSVISIATCVVCILYLIITLTKHLLNINKPISNQREVPLRTRIKVWRGKHH